VTQLAGALVDVVGRREAERIFSRAGALRLFHDPPGRMVDEAVVQRLYDVVDQSFDADISEWIAYDAGRRTAAYVAKNRIPAIARMVIGMLPPALGARVLLKAIVAHAWTFAGSGRVAARAGETVLIEITDNPLRTRKGQWHRGVLEGLFQALVSGQMQCRHEMLVGEDGPVCRFEIKRRQRGRRPCAAAGA
jgi:divinyl protochlorophyllide a 8-vinyl-reductase